VSKYDVLRDNLSKLSSDVTFQLDQLSDMIPGGLPPSAYRYEAWWNNDDPSHSHCRSWGDAGYTAQVDLARKRVRFVPR